MKFLELKSIKYRNIETQSAKEIARSRKVPSKKQMFVLIGSILTFSCNFPTVMIVDQLPKTIHSSFLLLLTLFGKFNRW